MQPERLVETSALDDGLSVFVSVRPRLFGIAYRMLGSAAEAEDVVQEVTRRSAARSWLAPASDRTVGAATSRELVPGHHRRPNCGVERGGMA